MKVLFSGCRYAGDAVLSFRSINLLVFLSLDVRVATPSGLQERYNGILGLSKVIEPIRRKGKTLLVRLIVAAIKRRACHLLWNMFPGKKCGFDIKLVLWKKLLKRA